MRRPGRLLAVPPGQLAKAGLGWQFDVMGCPREADGQRRAACPSQGRRSRPASCCSPHGRALRPYAEGQLSYAIDDTRLPEAADLTDY